MLSRTDRILFSYGCNQSQMAPQFKGRLLAFHNEVLEQTSHEYVANVWRRRHGFYRLTIFRCKATTMPWWQSPSSSLDDVTDRGATPRLNFPLSLECDEATLLCREWPVFEVDEVILPAPFPFPLATSDLTDSERSGISFMESGLSSGVSVFSITFVVDVVDDVFNDVLLALLSRWFGWKDNNFFTSIPFWEKEENAFVVPTCFITHYFVKWLPAFFYKITFHLFEKITTTQKN